MAKPPSALLVLLSHAVAGCQALHLEAPVRPTAGLRGGGDAPVMTPYGSFPATGGCLDGWIIGGQLGNQFSGFADALFLAEMCGIPCVHVSEWEQDAFRNMLDLPEDVRVDSPYSRDNTSALCEQAARHMLDTAGVWADLPPMNWAKKLFNKHLYSRLKPHPIEGLYRDDTLLIHLRGKDVLWSAKADDFYMPAPCGFFADVMRGGRQGEPFSHVVAVSDDPEHPCLSILGLHMLPKQTLRLVVASDGGDGHGPAAFQYAPNSTLAHYSKARAMVYDGVHSLSNMLARWTFEEDFMALASAKNVAWSASSTFSMNGVMMNPHDVVNVFMPTYKGVKACCDGSFKQSRLEELCRIGESSRIYEIPFPTGYQSVYASRKEWLQADDFKINASTVIHRCNEVNLHDGR